MRSEWIVSFALAALLAAHAGSPEYQLKKKVPLPGSGGWDYLTVDDANRRIYVSHATQVVVLNADSLEVTGTIQGLAGVHGITTIPELNRGFITSGQQDAVVVFDTNNLSKVAEIKVGKKPDAIVYDPASKRVFAMNGDSASSTAIDPATNKVVGTVPLGGGPEFTVADGKGNVFVNLEDKNELLRIDSQSLQVKDRWTVAPCEAPSSMAFDPANSRLFLGCRNKVMAVVDSTNGKVVANFPIGDKADASVFDKTSKIAFTSTGDGHIYAFQQNSADNYTPLPVIATVSGSKTMTLDPKTQHLLVPARDSDAVVLLILAR
jgi:YVTN family beta-propeller protein